MKVSCKRETKETKVDIDLDPDGSGRSEIVTGVELLDEILRNLAEASDFDLTIRAEGDLQTGDHHTTEDVGITLGTTLADLMNKGMGSSMVPSGNCLALASVRFGEPFFSGEFNLETEVLCGMSLENFRHFMRSLAFNGRFTLYLIAYGNNNMRKIEAMSLALGRALKEAYQNEREIDKAGRR
jgi:imidazoleglycerol-phosphate dehydratase